MAAAFLLIYCAVTPASAAGTTAEVGALRVSPSCDRALGQCAVGGDAEEAAEVAVAVPRQGMAARQPRDWYISCAALRADQVPCNQRGRSYHSNCASAKPANPYRQGCSAITRCACNTQEE